MNEHLFSRHFGCRISDASTYNGLRLVILENELLQVVIFPEKGAEIISLRFKPADLDPLLHLHRGPFHPGPFPVTISLTRWRLFRCLSRGLARTISKWGWTM